MSPSLLLSPHPQKMVLTGGTFEVRSDHLISLESSNPHRLYFAGSRIKKAVRERFKLNWQMIASRPAPADPVAVTLQVTPNCLPHDQGYRLTITPAGITILARTEAGVFYGVCTLIQILEQSGANLPCLRIEDWPDFPNRGVMLDISRDKVPTIETLHDLIDMLAGWKINQLQFYTEHTFAYRQHPLVWANASPLTGEEILELDTFCRERHIQLVPNQNSFGHMRRWLAHPAYASLAEVEGGFDAPWGREEGPFSLCPLDRESLALVRGLYDELLPHFSSRLVNVGCDETFDLGQGRSKLECEQNGAGQVYLNYLLSIYRDLKSRGFAIQFWSDIILKYPEVIPYLPRDMIALDWGYEANHPFGSNGELFATAGIPFYVCPGTSSWCSIAGRTNNALRNLIEAAENGLKHGAIGYLITDWGDNGHWQFLPISFLGFLAGAAYAWALAPNRELDIPEALNRHAFHDRAGVMGGIAYNLGNVYREVGLEPINTSVLFTILQRSLAVLRTKDYLRPVPFEHVLQAIDQLLAPLSQAEMDRPDGQLIIKEFQLTARMLRHACRRGSLAVAEAGDLLSPEQRQKIYAELEMDLRAFIGDYQQLWLSRNRPGGLTDSVARFEKALQDYLSLEKDTLTFSPVPSA